jgi:hypothetical protein
MTTVILLETAHPSQSQGRGWAFYRTDAGVSIFAAPDGGRPIEVDGPFELHLGVELSRASGRTAKERRRHTLVPEEGAVTELTIGGPQSYDVRVEGARLAVIR